MSRSFRLNPYLLRHTRSHKLLVRNELGAGVCHHCPDFCKLLTFPFKQSERKGETGFLADENIGTIDGLSHVNTLKFVDFKIFEVMTDSSDDCCVFSVTVDNEDANDATLLSNVSFDTKNCVFHDPSGRKEFMCEG